MPKTTPELRALWKGYECKLDDMVQIPFGPDRIRVAPPTVPAWEALAAVLLHHGYEIDTRTTDSYNCREITGGTGKSLHSYGIALDVNWGTNPYRDHAGSRPVIFSKKPTQAERADEVRRAVADTDMTEAMIADVAKIATKAGVRVFEWGGSWLKVKDAMHFELDLGPTELAVGIDTSTVVGWDALPDRVAALDARPGSAEAEQPGPSGQGERYVVNARSGLRLRGRAESDPENVIRLLPNGTPLFVLNRRGDWALVDLEGDGQADGFVGADYLKAADAVVVPVAAAVAAGPDIVDRVTVEHVARMFPVTPASKITKHLPFVLDGLRSRALGDRPMVLMALATIRAETEGFEPISEYRSQYNTRVTPFDRYDPGTDVARNLGNTQPGDGARFKGRGFVQLTGRDNYTRIGPQVGADLVGNPDLANDPRLAGLILAQFIKNQERGIRRAVDANDLRAARRLVNGGSHGLERFVDAYRRGTTALPA